MKRSHIRRAVGATVLVLVASACGSQVDRSVFEVSAGDAGGATGSPSAGDSGGFVVVDGGSGVDTGSGTGGVVGVGSGTDVTGSGTATGGTDTGTSPGDTGQNPGDSGQGGGNGPVQAKANYASDVGVTATAIKVGNITTVGGPMPGQFEPWLQGLQTWINKTNERGGINGRKLDFVTCDDAMDAERNKNCARDLIEKQKVFAIVGTNGPAMPSADYIDEQKVPAVGVAAIGNYTSQLPYWFAENGARTCPRNGVRDPSEEGYCASNTIRGSNASYKFFKNDVGVQRAAVFWHNIDISKQAGLDMSHALTETGVEVVYEAETQVAEPDYTGHVVNMKQAKVQGIWEAMEINNNIRLLQAMDRQEFLPLAKVSTVSSYGQEIGKQVTGPSRNTLFALSNTRGYNDIQAPGIAEFIDAFDRYFPNASKHAWIVGGYRGGVQFGDAAAALGADLTREGLVDWLNAQKDWNTLDLGIPTDWQWVGEGYFQEPKPRVACTFVAQFKDTDWFNFTADGKPSCTQGDWISSRS